MQSGWWVVALTCASCGRVSFDPFGRTDAMAGDGAGDGVSADVGIDGPPAAPFVQTVDFVLDSTPKSSPITAVDPARTIVLCDFRSASSSTARQPRCELVDATTVTVTTAQPEPSLLVHVQVVQLPAGVIVQRGLSDMTGLESSHMVSIAPVDLAHSFVVASRSVDLESTTGDSQVTMTAKLVNPTTLQFDRLLTGAVVRTAWQVVTWPAATVNSGVSMLGDSIAGSSDSSGVSDFTQAFLVASSTAPTSNERDYMVAMNLNLNRSFNRFGASGAISIAWSTIETPQIRVQSGITAMGTMTVNTANLPSAIADVNRAFVVLSAQGGRIGQNADFDEIRCIAGLTSTQVVLSRGTTTPVDVGGGINWQVIEML